MVYAVLVKFVLRRASDRPAFLDRIAELYRYSNAEEPGTLTYELHGPAEADLTDNEKPYTVLLIERYTNTAALVDVHLHSEQFKKFAAWFGQELDAGILLSISKEAYNRIEPPAPATDDSDTVATSKNENANAPAAAASNSASNNTKPADGIMVFCGARNGSSTEYVAHATRVGELIAARRRPLIYGGGTVGVMGAVASAVRDNGGRVIGVIPSALAPREASVELIGEVHVVQTMHVRKELMFSMANWLVVLPGGIGTLDELFEVLTLCQLNAYKCRVALLNTNNFYGPLVAALRHLVSQGFLEQYIVDEIILENTPEAVFDALEKGTELTARGFCAGLRWDAPATTPASAAQPQNVTGL